MRPGVSTGSRTGARGKRGGRRGASGPVLAAADFSEAADEAVRQGHSLAAALGAPFIVCHVLPEVFNVRVLFPQDADLDVPAQEQLEARAREAIKGRVAQIVGRSRGEEIAIGLGSPHAGILEAADRLRAGVIVLGPGATAQRVARAAVCPTLVARPSPAGGGGPRSHGFLGSILPAVHLAADEAKRRGVRFRVVYRLRVRETAYSGSAGIPEVTVALPLPQSVIDQLDLWARARLAVALRSINTVSEPVVLRHRRPPASSRPRPGS